MLLMKEFGLNVKGKTAQPTFKLPQSTKNGLRLTR